MFSLASGGEIVQQDDGIAPFHQTLGQVRPDESRAASDQIPLRHDGQDRWTGSGEQAWEQAGNSDKLSLSVRSVPQWMSRAVPARSGRGRPDSGAHDSATITRASTDRRGTKEFRRPARMHRHFASALLLNVNSIHSFCTRGHVTKRPCARYSSRTRKSSLCSAKQTEPSIFRGRARHELCKSTNDQGAQLFSISPASPDCKETDHGYGNNVCIE